MSVAPVPGLELTLALADRIPDLDHFPGVDEMIAAFEKLSSRHPELIQTTRIGTSRLGEPLIKYQIGEGGRSALVYAGVHPNEPIGFCTALQLAETLCRDDDFRTGLNCTWHIIACIDPDGTRLNEGWFAGPWDRVNYARQFYRPAPGEQVEWSFPLQHKLAYFDEVIPEAFALMRVIDDVRPDIAVSLHNGELGGVYYYLTRDIPLLIDDLHDIAAHFELPLDRGEPESPVSKVLGEAVFTMISAKEVYDYEEQLGMTPSRGAGGSSAEYAERHGTVSMVAELPYWIHPAVDDETPTQQSYRDVITGAAEELSSDITIIGDVFQSARPWLSDASQLVRATAAFVPSLQKAATFALARVRDIPGDRLATVAEEFSAWDRNRCFRLRYGGMLLRALEGEVARGAAPAELHRLAASFGQTYGDWQAEASTIEDSLTRVPIKRLVGVQFAATLALLDRTTKADDQGHVC